MSLLVVVIKFAVYDKSIHELEVGEAKELLMRDKSGSNSLAPILGLNRVQYTVMNVSNSYIFQSFIGQLT